MFDIRKELDEDELEELRHDYGMDEDEIKTLFDRVNVMSQEEKNEIDDFIEDRVSDEILENSSEYQDAISAIFEEDNPRPNEDDYENEDDFSEKEMEWDNAYSNWYNGVSHETMLKAISIAYNAIDDSVTDEMRRDATNAASAEYNLPVVILRHICHAALG